MAISAVGSPYVGQGAKTLSVSPTAVGNILVLAVPATANAAANPSAVSGGGVTTWNHINGYALGLGLPTADLWWGVITATGSQTITITDTTAVADIAMFAQEFTGGSSGTWAADGTGGNAGSGTPSSSGNYPSLTPAGANELYVGCLASAVTGLGGSSSGFTYFNPIGATGVEANGAFVYNASASSPTAQSPAWTSSGGRYAVASGLLAFTPTVSYVPRPAIVSQAVMRAANWAKRESGLWSPESGLIPRAA